MFPTTPFTFLILSHLPRYRSQTLHLKNLLPQGFTRPAGPAVVAWIYAYHPTRWQVKLTSAARYGKLDIIEMAYSMNSKQYSRDVMNVAAEYGWLDIVKFLHIQRHKWSLEDDKKNVHWFESPQSCSTHAMDGAAANGHIEVVRFLHKIVKKAAQMLPWTPPLVTGIWKSCNSCTSIAPKAARAMQFVKQLETGI
ncbi:hypothetical protein BC829DRAFT_439344 [Chytridium lagenaria]|nr:hypothetical protein BC829DRAFT_439344 [Chytridium lagenaria]